MKKPFKIGLRKFAAVSAAIAVIASSTSVTAFAADKTRSAVDAVCEALEKNLGTNYSNDYIVDNPKVDTASLPSKFDLRDVNGKCYVPEIRLQNPFGTCWSFAITAAAEISAAAELDADFNTMTDEQKSFFDFSERHTAWFAFEPIHDDDPLYASQAGEGVYRVYSSDYLTDEEKDLERFNSGGFSLQGSPLFASGVGPVNEKNVPYINNAKMYDAYLLLMDIDENKNKNNITVVFDHENVPYSEFMKKVDEAKKIAKNYSDGIKEPGKYYYASYSPSEKGDWSVDYSQKYGYAWQLDNASSLPSPANIGENLEYSYNELATNAVKRELVAKRGVAVHYLADQSSPGDTIENASYMNFLTKDGKETDDTENAAIWAQYTYDKDYDPSDPDSINKYVFSNHVVCIVGYDDNFPKEYFNDPNGTIGGNGAWIVRNSWGSKENSVESSRSPWGNNGDGYFYLSYYDQSMILLESYDFRTSADGNTDNADGIYNHMYDHVLTNKNELITKNDVYMANEFTEEGDTVLTDVGLYTVSPNSTVRFDVYFLNENSKNPTDGRKMVSATKTFDYAGYHCVSLDKQLAIPEGQKYSIVAKVVREDGTKALLMASSENENYFNQKVSEAREKYIAENGTDLGFKPNSVMDRYIKAVINKGESFVGAKTANGVEWADWKDVTDIFKQQTKNTIDYDNFSIRAYVKGNVLEVKNTVLSDKKVYEAGDIIEGSVTIKNDVSSTDTYTIENIRLEHNLGAISEEDAFIKSLNADESKTIKYEYKVTEEDAAAGSITSTINITVNGEPYSFVKELAKNTFTVNTGIAPAVPTNVKAGKDGKITWDAAENAEYYRVKKFANGTAYYSGKITDTNYTLNKLPTTNYQVAVIAYGKGDISAKSKTVSVKADPKLGYVNSVTVDKDGNAVWDAADNAAAYRVCKVVNGKTYYGAKTEETNYKLASVPNKDYQVFVVAYDADGRTSWGKKNLVEVGKLGVVFNTKADKNGKVTWDAARNAAYYRVCKVVDGKTYAGAKTENTSYTLASVPETDYQVYVVAFDKDGNKVSGAKVNVKI